VPLLRNTRPTSLGQLHSTPSSASPLGVQTSEHPPLLLSHALLPASCNQRYFVIIYLCAIHTYDATQLNSTVGTVSDNKMTSLALRRHAAVHCRPDTTRCLLAWLSSWAELSWVGSRRRRKCELAISLPVSHRNVRSVISAHNLTPLKRDDWWRLTCA